LSRLYRLSHKYQFSGKEKIGVGKIGLNQVLPNSCSQEVVRQTLIGGVNSHALDAPKAS